MKTCSKCKLSKNNSDFYRQGDRKSGLHSQCKKCFNKKCIDRWIKRKLDAVEYLGGKCMDCSTKLDNENYVIFDFHHRDPNEKDFNWTKMRLTSWTKILLELDKCDCLCSNCHRLRHKRQTGVEPV